MATNESDQEIKRAAGERIQELEALVRELEADNTSLVGALDDFKGELTKQLERMRELETEQDALQRHYDAAGPEHNLLALLDLYHERKCEAEAERDKARGEREHAWQVAGLLRDRLEADQKALTKANLLVADGDERLKTLAKIALGYIAFPVPAQEHALRETAEAALASPTPAAAADDCSCGKKGPGRHDCRDFAGIAPAEASATGGANAVIREYPSREAADAAMRTTLVGQSRAVQFPCLTPWRASRERIFNAYGERVASAISAEHATFIVSSCNRANDPQLMQPAGPRQIIKELPGYIFCPHEDCDVTVEREGELCADHQREVDEERARFGIGARVPKAEERAHGGSRVKVVPDSVLDAPIAEAFAHCLPSDEPKAEEP